MILNNLMNRIILNHLVRPDVCKNVTIYRLSCLIILIGKSLSRSQSIEQRMEQVNEEEDLGNNFEYT